MISDSVLKDLININQMLIRARNAYYVGTNNSIMSDSVYDTYENYLRKELDKHPEYKTHIPDLVTETVGAKNVVINSFDKTAHREPMISLDNVFNFSQLETWVETVCAKLRPGGIYTIYLCELKFDGLAIDLIYDNGILIQAATRGNGVVGEIVTNNVLTIKNVPKTIPDKNLVNIRGEVIINNSDFIKMNEELLANNLPTMANPRNAAAGSIRLLSPEDAAKRPLSFYPYELVNPPSNMTSHIEARNYFKEMGFDVPRYFCETNAVTGIESYYMDILRKRNDIDHPIDGIVIKEDLYSVRKILGENRRVPYWAIAYKFPPETAIATLDEVIWQVGRTGKLTPVALFYNPVNIFGASISRCTLNNASEIKRLNLRLGASVIVERSGDVIPKIVGVVETSHLNTSMFNMMIKIPTECPTCLSTLIKRDDNGIHIYCANALCKSVQSKQIEYWCSRNVMNILGMGEAIVEILCDNNLLDNVSDLYRLKDKVPHMLLLEGFGIELINKILASIESSRNPFLNKYITGLGIDGIAEVTANKIAMHVDTVNDFINGSLDLNISQGIWQLGTVVSEQLCSYMHINYNYVESLEEVVGTCKPSKITVTNDVLKGYSFCITGSFENYTRDQIKERILECGGTVVDNVTSKTSALICGENAGSKYSKATKLNKLIYFNTWVNILMSDNIQDLGVPNG